MLSFPRHVLFCMLKKDFSKSEMRCFMFTLKKDFSKIGNITVNNCETFEFLLGFVSL